MIDVVLDGYLYVIIVISNTTGCPVSKLVLSICWYIIQGVICPAFEMFAVCAL